MDGDYTGAEHTYIVKTLDRDENTASHRYILPLEVFEELQANPDPFGNNNYGRAVFLKTYSRRTYVSPRRSTEGGLYCDNIEISDYIEYLNTPRKETWADVVVRVVEGLFSYYISGLVQHMSEKMYKAINTPEYQGIINESMPTEENLSDLFLNSASIFDFKIIDMIGINKLASSMARGMYQMKWLPPGRGIYAMGTDHTFRNGAAALNNCYFTSTRENIIKSAVWGMDMSMNGGGVGFDVSGEFEVRPPNKDDNILFVIPDTREGWCAAYELLLRAYIPIDGQITNKFPIFNFSLVRPKGEPIKGFGGVASGPEPLRKLLDFTEICLDAYLDYRNSDWQIIDLEDNEDTKQAKIFHNRTQQIQIYLNMFERMHEQVCYLPWDSYDYDSVRNEITEICANNDIPFDHVQLIANLFNSWAHCVISGNVRRSAQIMLGDPEHENLLKLKDYNLYPWRRHIMHLSNNSYRLSQDSHFDQMIPIIAERIKTNGEPGIINMINIRKYARYADISYGEDNAEGINPCGETPLADMEACCLSIFNPYLCRHQNGTLDLEQVLLSAKYASFYASVVSTIRHHWQETNEITRKNHRIGVSFGGITDIYSSYGYTTMIKIMRLAYKEIREENTKVMSRFGFASSIRVTVVKPEGNTSCLTGLSPGVHFPICEYAKRRVIFDIDDPILKMLKLAGHVTEKSVLSDTQEYVIFPLKCNPKNRSAEMVSFFEKLSIAACTQKHYADNSVSVTVDFTSQEKDQLEDAIAMNIAHLKAVSLLPQFKTPTNERGKALYYVKSILEQVPPEKYASKLDELLIEHENLPDVDEICDTRDFYQNVAIKQYAHLPYESISQKTYQELADNISEIDWSAIYNPSYEIEDLSRDKVSYCTSDSCDFIPSK